MPGIASRTLRPVISEAGGACGDLGTFIPHVIGAITVAGLAPCGVLFGFGVFLCATGLFYGLPLPVQPMKAVSAVILTEGMSPGELADAGLVLGLVLFVLGITGAITRLARLVPQSVATGLQFGLGLLMGVLGVKLILQTPWVGFAALAMLAVMTRVPRLPAAPIVLAAAAIFGWATHRGALPPVALGWSLPHFVAPSWPGLRRSVEIAVLPQLSLTLTNAIIVTASLSRELFSGFPGAVTERKLALSSGLANLLLAPLGAMPMCHGAGGLQAHYRFGARTGLAPAILGVVLLVLALGFSGSATALFALIPIGAVGALLVLAGVDLAITKRLFDARPSCWPVIGAAGLATLLLNPALGLVLGWAAEFVRAAVMRRLAPRPG